MATFEQKMKIVERLRELLTVIDKDRRIVKYEPGWTDVRLAKEFNVSYQTIANVRNTVFGQTLMGYNTARGARGEPLYGKTEKKKPFDYIKARDELIDTLRDIKHALGQLEKRVSGLESRATEMNTSIDSLVSIATDPQNDSKPILASVIR